MTISRQPWTIEEQNSRTWIKDADGTVIGLFDDWQNAEHVIKQSEKIALLEAEIDRLEDDLL